MSVLSTLTTAATGAVSKVLKDRSDLLALVPSKEEIDAANIAIGNFNNIIAEPPTVPPQQ